MALRLKGTAPAPGETDKRYYMIDVQEGNRRERISTGTRDKALAQRKEQAVVDALRADLTIPKADLVSLVRGHQRGAIVNRRAADGETLSEAVSKCMADNEVWGRNTDRKKNGERMAHVMAILGKDTPLSAVDHDAIDKLKRALEALGNAPATINRKFSALRVVLNNAVDRRVLVGFPKIKKQKGERKRKFILTADDERQLYAAMLARDEREQAVVGGHPVLRDAHLYVRFFQLLGETGMRPAEMFQLTWRNTDFTRSVAKVVHSPHAGTKTKSKKDRNVPLTDRAKALLLERWGVVKGGPFHDLNQRRANSHWSAARLDCGITDIDCVPYAQRHTVATKLGEELGDLNSIKEWLGHSTITLTSDTYLHTTQSHLNKGADALSSRRRQDEAELLNRDRDSPETGTSPATTSAKLN